MNIGILLPGFSVHESDWAIPVQLNLVRELARRADVRVLALRYPHRRGIYSVHGAAVYSLGAGQARGWRRLALWWDALRLLRRLHRERPFHVLHAMWADETGLIAAWARRWLDVPVAVSIAGGELVGYDDIGYGMQRSAFSRWTVGRALHGADCVIAPCSYTRRLISQAGYLVPDTRISAITLGVDTTLFQPGENAGIAHQSVLTTSELIHVGSLVGVKDQATLLRALALLDGVALKIVGTGPEQPGLERLAAELGIAGRVRFAGAVQHLDLPDYYRRATLNILSSRHEGLGMVVLEAAACGVPTVGTAVGLLPDLPRLGMTVPVGDSPALAGAIKALLDDPAQRAALGKSASEVVTNAFTIQHTVEQLCELYQMLEGRSHG